MLSFKTYRRAAVPLLAVETADAAGVVKLAVSEAANGAVQPVLVWDCIKGIGAANEPARAIADELNQGQPAPIATGNPIEALRAIETLGSRENRTAVVMVGLADILADPQTATPAKQALWNLRDALPTSGSILIFTVPFGWRNPFPNDIAVAVDPLPNADELKAIVVRICSAAKAAKPDDEKLGRCADALLGVSRFAAEQAVALSTTPKTGVNLDGLWQRKRQQVAQTPGLKIYNGREKFSDLGGVEQAKSLFTRLLNGNRKPGCVVFIDEIEKALAGSGGTDSSGVSDALLGYLLTYMEDQQATGAIFYGQPGAAKSALGKAIGNEGEIPTVLFDLGGTKDSLVGNSEARAREALAVITAISAGRPMFIATCNSMKPIKPELIRRFTLGTIFFDLPTDEEKDSIWPIYLKKYELPKQPLPNCVGWTGANIKQCCDMADRLGVSLIEAARLVVPGWISARDSIEQRRLDASGKYLSASATGAEDGIYRAAAARSGGARRMET